VATSARLFTWKPPPQTCPVAKFGRPHIWGFGFWHEGEFIAEGYVKCVCGQIEED
jgi:hypothetical protein